MPRIPEVKLRPDSTPFQQIGGVTPGAFGAHEASAQIETGRAIGQASDQVFDIVIRQQTLDNEKKAKELDLRFAREKRELLYSPNGLYSKKGTNAVEQSPEFKEQVQKIKDRLSGEADSEQVRRMFGLSADSRIETEFGNIDRFVLREQEVAVETVSQARMKEAIDDAVLAGDNDNVMNQSLAIIQSEISSQAQRNGWEPEVAQSKFEEATTLLHRSNIISMLQKQLPEDAADYFQKYSGQMDAPVAAEMKERITKSERVAEAQRLTDNIFADSSLTTDKERVDAAMRTRDPVLRDSVVERTRLRNRDERLFQEGETRASGIAASQLIFQGSTLADIEANNPDLWAQIIKDPLLIARLKAAQVLRAKGKSPFAELSNGYTMLKFSRMEPLAMANLSEEYLWTYAQELTEVEWNTLILWHKGDISKLEERAYRDLLRKKQQDQKKSDLQARLDRNHLEQLAQRRDSSAEYKRAIELIFQFDPTGKMKTSKAGSSSRKLFNALSHQLSEWLQPKVNAGTRIPDIEIQDFVRKLILPIERANVIMDFLQWAPGVDTAQYAVELFEMTPEQRENFRINLDDIDFSYLAIVKEHLRSKGVDVNDEKTEEFIRAEVFQDRETQLRIISEK